MQRQNSYNVKAVFFTINLQVMDTSSSLRHSKHHDIVAFLVSILLTLVQIRYPSQDLFHSDHKTMKVVMSSLLEYCFVFAVISYIDYVYGHKYGRKHNWYCCMAIVVFGAVPVASLLSLLFPHHSAWWRCLLYLLWMGQLLLALVLLRELVRPVTKTLPPFHTRRRSALLPLRVTDVTANSQYGHSLLKYSEIVAL